VALLVIVVGFAVFALKSSEQYTVFHCMWMAMAVGTALLMRMWTACAATSDHWCDAGCVHIVISAVERHSEFKAVCRWLTSCGLMSSHLAVHIRQDEDEVEEVHISYTHWARSFVKKACIFGRSGAPSSIKFRNHCMQRYCGECICRICGTETEPHEHIEIRYDKAEYPHKYSNGYVVHNNKITISVADHQAEVLQHMLLRAYQEFIQPQRTRIEVYSAHGVCDAPQGTSSASWEFMQYISPLSPQRTGRCTYVSGQSCADIEAEYRRVVSLGNESLTVLATGKSRSGKNAMVNGEEGEAGTIWSRTSP